MPCSGAFCDQVNDQWATTQCLALVEAFAYRCAFDSGYSFQVLNNNEAERLRLFISQVSDYAIYMLSEEGEVASWNAGAQRFKGYTSPEILGKHFSAFYTDEDRTNGIPNMALQTARENGRYEAEGWRVRKDGSRFWAHVVIDAIREQDGTLLGFAKITKDITERRNSAEALERAREALFQSQKLDAMGQITGGVAHDFNNLLSVITNSLVLLRPKLTDQRSLELVAAIEKAAYRGATLTGQLLSFARQQPMNQAAWDLGRVIGSFEPVLRRAGRGTVTLQVETAPTHAVVWIDASHFETALLNLVVNACDATLDGGKVHVSAKVVEVGPAEVGVPAGTYVVVSVEDTGAGMPDAVVARAVEPFFTTKAVGKGTGLGLSQVHGMVQQSGGELKISSHLGVGTTVSMYFPVSEEHTTIGDVEAPVSDKVLVVDDQVEVLEVTAELFSSLGFDVLTANCAPDAVDILKRTSDVQLLFSDVVMPGMNGVKLAQMAREITPGTRVLLTSGHSAPAGSLEGFAFIAKPYSMAALMTKIRALA